MGGLIVPGMDIVETVFEQLVHCHRDGLLGGEGDIICITESVVARAQNNYVTTADVAREVKEKHTARTGEPAGPCFPIASRNRFALVLRGGSR